MIETVERRGRVWTLAVLPMLAVLLAAVMVGCDEPAAAEVADGTILAAADQVQELSGTWVLNLEASQLPERGGSPYGRRARSRERHGPNGPPEGARRRGPRGPRFGGALEIVEGEGSVTITRNGRRSMTFYTDGRIETHETPRGHHVEVSASFEGSSLVIQHAIEDGANLVRTLTPSEDGQQLVVMHAVDHPKRGTREFKLVYDRT